MLKDFFRNLIAACQKLSVAFVALFFVTFGFLFPAGRKDGEARN